MNEFNTDTSHNISIDNQSIGSLTEGVIAEVIFQLFDELSFDEQVKIIDNLSNSI